MQDMQLLMDYAKAYESYDQFMQNKQNTPTKKQIVDNTRVIKTGNKALNEINKSIDQRQREYDQQVRLANQLDSDLEELEKDISYYTEAEAGELTQEEYSDMVNEAKRIVAQNDKVRKSFEDLRKTLDKQEQELRNLIRGMLAAQKNLEELNKTYKEEQAQKSDEEKELENTIAEFEKKIPAKVVEEFKRIKVNKIKPVVLYEDGRCKGCNMQLPPLYTKRIASEELVTCEHCGRILVTI